MSAVAVRASARLLDEEGVEVSAPAEMVTAMLEFEERYGGLSYRLLSANPMGYGLDGQPVGYRTGHGWAFGGVLDGDWTAVMDVLVDGRIAFAPGRALSRVIDRTVDQRLEKHALLAEVRTWPHRAFTITVPPGLIPQLATGGLPPVATEATGPATMWWHDQGRAVQLDLDSWWQDRDDWILRCFTRHRHDLAGAVAATQTAANSLHPSEATWCGICVNQVPAGQVCLPDSQ
jgi:hypothetical protein